MARYEHLPIYKAAIDLAVFMENAVRNMGRYNKYAIGAEMRKRAIDAVSLVARANSVDDRRAAHKKIDECDKKDQINRSVGRIDPAD